VPARESWSLNRDLPAPDARARAAVRRRAADVLRPPGALGALDFIAEWLAAWQRTERPAVRSPAALVFVGDHGVASEGVSAYPSSVTASMLQALQRGQATACALARCVGARLEVVDVGVGKPTGNIAIEDALGRTAFSAAVEAGRSAVREVDADLLVLGEMGIANTTPAAAVSASLFGGEAAQWTGAGTGVGGAALEHKARVVERARHRIGDERDPLEVLRRVGGSELAAIAGAALEARLRSIPALLDGYVVTAAVAPLERAVPGSLEHCRLAHRSAERGHVRLLELLGMSPILSLDLRLGEGSGALLAVPLIRAAAAAVTDVATFAELGIVAP
jgi:nicotinate-nucleotide--dimethylbenzimidazole phosphoribosyltransferase